MKEEPLTSLFTYSSVWRQGVSHIPPAQRPTVVHPLSGSSGEDEGGHGRWGIEVQYTHDRMQLAVRAMK